MVEIVATFLGQYALAIHLEGHLVSLDCYTNWLLRHSFHQRLLVVCRNIEITNDRAFGYTDCAAGLGASSILGCVWVAALRAHCMVLPKSKSIIHEATTAATVLHGAINELLLAEGHKFASGHFPSTFECTGGREGPTGATSALVFDRGDCAFRGPIYGLWQGSAAVAVSSQVRQALPELT